MTDDRVPPASEFIPRWAGSLPGVNNMNANYDQKCGFPFFDPFDGFDAVL